MKFKILLPALLLSVSSFVYGSEFTIRTLANVIPRLSNGDLRHLIDGSYKHRFDRDLFDAWMLALMEASCKFPYRGWENIHEPFFGNPMRGRRVFNIQYDVNKNPIGIEPGGFVATTANVPLLYEYGDFAISKPYIGENVFVFQGAEVLDNARLKGNTYIYGNAVVEGDAYIGGSIKVFGDARIFGEAQLVYCSEVGGKARIGGTTILQGAHIYNLELLSGTFRSDFNESEYKR